MKPTAGWPSDLLAVFSSVMKAANTGAAAEVPYKLITLPATTTCDE